MLHVIDKRESNLSERMQELTLNLNVKSYNMVILWPKRIKNTIKEGAVSAKRAEEGDNRAE